MRTTPSAHRIARRGVILLVVMKLLALFTLIAITYVISTGGGRTSATAKAQRTGDPPQALLERGLFEVLRGSRDPFSPVQARSLLEDIYSNDWFAGVSADLATDWLHSSHIRYLPC